MKTQIVLALLVATTSQAGVPDIGGGLRGRPVISNVYAPNSYVCYGEKVIYNVNLTSEQPSFTVTGLGHPTEMRVGVELRNVSLSNQSMGQLVVGFDPHIADANIVYTLILPNVLLSAEQSEIEFETTLVRTFEGTFFERRRLPGVQKRNTLEAIKCTASKYEVEAPEAIGNK